MKKRHEHDYKICIIPLEYHSYFLERKVIKYYFSSYCTICGKLNDAEKAKNKEGIKGFFTNAFFQCISEDKLNKAFKKYPVTNKKYNYLYDKILNKECLEKLNEFYLYH